MALIRKSTRWIPAVYVLLVASAIGSGAITGRYWNAGTTTVYVQREKISARASASQVRANFAGKPYVVGGQLSELPNFKCNGWTRGARSHGWVVLLRTLGLAQ